MVLGQLQSLLTRLYDAPIEEQVDHYLLTERSAVAALAQADANTMTDEQVLVVEEEGGLQIGVYIDPVVIARLRKNNPLEALNDHNLPDYCTALEGVSHFHYLAWSAQQSRQVSLLELEVQAEVDKYAGALYLLTRQGAGRFPASLHARLFDRVKFAPGLPADGLQRYREAHRCAARFCRWLEERFLGARRVRPEAWLTALRQFHTHRHHEKMRYAAACL
jgi:hypothetical protein